MQGPDSMRFFTRSVKNDRLLATLAGHVSIHPGDAAKSPPGGACVSPPISAKVSPCTFPSAGAKVSPRILINIINICPTVFPARARRIQAAAG